ncbi:MAG TPA: 2-alkenal reductase, partial [Rhodocyclaceae bacterium]|nr:2-alkenal reductase [Rhodocyclaceae bacterium]
MRKLWLIFAQTVTVALAVLFVVGTLKPEWLGRHPSVVELQEAAPAGAGGMGAAGYASFRDAA